jgi:hypothetical protein
MVQAFFQYHATFEAVADPENTNDSNMPQFSIFAFPTLWRLCDEMGNIPGKTSLINTAIFSNVALQLGSEFFVSVVSQAVGQLVLVTYPP